MPPSSIQKPLDIAIVGGGIAGLALAISLLKHCHINLTIYESAQRFGEIGAGVAFGSNAVSAMALIDPRIKEGFEKVATRPLWDSKKKLWFDFRYGKDFGEGMMTGDKVASVDNTGDAGTVHRADFLDALVHLIPDGCAQFGKRMVAMVDEGDAGVSLKFNDGTEARHTAVIGCDGIKSRVRNYILGAANPSAHPTFSGKSCHRGLVPMEKAVLVLGEELAQSNNLFMGPGGHIAFFPVQQGRTMNVVAHHSCPSWDNTDWVIPATREELLAEYEGWGEPVQKILRLMQDLNTWALFDMPAVDVYYKGRVCLTGDAAHASTPHQGSGAAMAMEDAYVLGILLGDAKDPSSLQVAFAAYDNVRRPRTQKLVATSREASHLFSMELPGVGANREALKESIEGRMSWIWDEDLTSEVCAARNIVQKSL
ncbi:hypothetical protein BP6252_10445 [Coleophoma cylindrospora]|uniref:FAD-binding domain-containing protein n=1 Tax=Coleophoma cylindrospora TaxID=1849047 RepID=A0A3D8QTE9_9HELO|nr:hypothetical protein BP6252_10445 [Coleophoma cylindrospora]